MKTSPLVEVQPNHDQIAAVAYSLWEKEGRQSGHDLDYWLKAENQLQGGKQQALQSTNPVPKEPAVAHGTTGTRWPGNSNSGT
jgi:hypothetical protein